MLRIIQGGLFSAAYEELKKEIRELTLKKKRIYLIAPEQQAVTAESEFIGFLPDAAPLTFEVTNFTRLANTVYRGRGGIAAEYSSSGKEALIMWKTLRELSPYLKMTEGCREISNGLVARALSACSEIKNLSLTPEELAEAAKSSSLSRERRLCEKLGDLSKIITLYSELLGEKYTSSEDDCERLAKILAESKELLCDAVFYVTGFTSFTKPQIAVLSSLMERTSVSVHLTLSSHTEDFFEFSELKATKAELLSAANKKGTEREVKKCEGRRVGANPQVSEITDLLWRSFGKIDNSSLQNIENSIKLYEASDPYEASSFIAADIKRAVMAGARYSDFAVISRDVAEYSGIIDSELANADIPCFISRRTDISQYEAIKLIYTAFSAVRSGFARNNVLTYAKCRLSGISAEACDEFELYVEKWQIDKGQFTAGAEWSMSPRGYDGGLGDDNTEALARISRTRHALIDPLKAFSEALRGANTVRDYARVLVSFLTGIGLEKKLSEKAKLLSELGEECAAEENGILWQTICHALDDMVDVLGDTEIGTHDFENQLKVILSEANIGKLPSYRDVVTVASADTARLSEKQHIYLLGVNAGEFPANGRPSSYFSDRDRSLLSSLGIISEDSGIASARELFFFSRAMAVAKGSVSLISFTRDAAYASTAAAAVMSRITDITDGAVRSVRISSLPLISRIYSPEAALSLSSSPEVRRALLDAGYGHELEVSERDIENLNARLGEGVRSLIYTGELSLTQSKINQYLDCPFAYFLNTGIRLSENGRAEFDARNIGTFIHAILESFFVELKESGRRAADTTAEERSEMVRRAAERYIDEKTSGAGAITSRTNIIIDRIHKASLPIIDGLCDELADCEYQPEFFELKISKDSTALPSPAVFELEGGGTADVHGIIDRVDIYKSGKDVYVRVIDYKTGSKSFSPSDIDEGRNLQMFLYLKAIVETDKEEFRKALGVGDGGRIIPAGVIYIKPDINDVTVSDNNAEAERDAIMKVQTRSGMILDDAESIGAMSARYIPVKFTKSGEPYKASRENLYTLEGWDRLNEKIAEQIRSVSRRMTDGELFALGEPDSEVCERCKFKSICRKKLGM